ncbi:MULTISPECIES: hypothetical protein [Mycobacterium]|uniref:hypothetical protein n=1 Tax=Mycobacterium TaxID=1763 RepID=UPI001EF059B5|nr:MULTISPECIES: hypothetical protein [Mycobacterium]BDB44550.1 hypothetical protein IWGMT90018_49960 [Mycobacterium kiyosense]BDE16057.1 hypothetical protein MKCMC460_49170 [Mycobacterium sp. 20KCMC460]GLB93041.1 hypothetical protein SRL2020130_58580 [Mycobacterium kiyosense]GLC04844.1 hypothetical protein SRL2020400_54350 [Mycobacterium kiyosense]GLC11246.1 hypothetical protein SRL2020411_58920 [Mycobacterium kiyosense]
MNTYGGPPEKEDGPHTQGPSDAEGSDTTTSTAHGSSAGRHSAQHLAGQLHRRRLAAARCVPLPCGHRDPILCAVGDGQAAAPTGHAPTRHQLDAWRYTVAYLAALGLPPLVPTDIAAALARTPVRVA